MSNCITNNHSKLKHVLISQITNHNMTRTHYALTHNLLISCHVRGSGPILPPLVNLIIYGDCQAQMPLPLPPTASMPPITTSHNNCYQCSSSFISQSQSQI